MLQFSLDILVRIAQLVEQRTENPCVGSSSLPSNNFNYLRYIVYMKSYLWNMFTLIKNGQMARKNVVIGSRKNICESSLKLLWNEGFISGYRVMSENSQKIEIFLKYTKNGVPAINSLKFISTPGRRVYYSAKQIWKLDSSKTFIVFSTNIGLKSINECKKNLVGGEPIVLIS